MSYFTTVLDLQRNCTVNTESSIYYRYNVCFILNQICKVGISVHFYQL